MDFVQTLINKNDYYKLSNLCFRFPDKDVGQFPMAYVMRKSGSNLSEKGIMDFVSTQVSNIIY